MCRAGPWLSPGRSWVCHRWVTATRRGAAAGKRPIQRWRRGPGGAKAALSPRHVGQGRRRALGASTLLRCTPGQGVPPRQPPGTRRLAPASPPAAGETLCGPKSGSPGVSPDLTRSRSCPQGCAGWEGGHRLGMGAPRDTEQDGCVVVSVSHGTWGRQRWADGDGLGGSTTLGFPAAPRLDQEGIWSRFFAPHPSRAAPCRRAVPCHPLCPSPPRASSALIVLRLPRMNQRKTKEKRKTKENQTPFSCRFFIPRLHPGTTISHPSPCPHPAAAEGQPGAGSGGRRVHPSTPTHPKILRGAAPQGPPPTVVWAVPWCWPGAGR